MSYNLLLNTNFTNIDKLKHWKLTNCEFRNGYLISNDKIFSIEQEIILPDPTRLYFALDYICFDSNITSIYCGIQSKDVLEATKKKPKLNKRKRISVVDSIKQEKVKVIFICESKCDSSRIYIDNPILVDLTQHNKDLWPKYVLNKVIDYRHGYDYENIYKYGSEISINNPDFNSPYTQTEEGNVGLLASIVEDDWFKLTHTFELDHYYLLKLDFEQINNYGEIYCSYGESFSIPLGEEQLYLIFKGNDTDDLKICLHNNEPLPYLINLKHLLLIDFTNLRLEEDDIQHLPFI